MKVKKPLTIVNKTFAFIVKAPEEMKTAGALNNQVQ